MYSKTIPVAVYHSESTILKRRLIITVYSKKILNEPDSYVLTLTSPEDAIMHYTSLAITPTVFRRLTQNMNLVKPDIPGADLLGFHPHQGVGGLLGVLGGDCIEGVLDDPDRNTCIFHINEIKERTARSAPVDSPLSQKFKWKDVPTTDARQEIMAAYTPKYDTTGPPTRQTGVLTFRERTMFAVVDVLAIEFKETDKTVVKQVIQEKFERIQVHSTTIP
jgi:hypothetical protein